MCGWLMKSSNRSEIIKLQQKREQLLLSFVAGMVPRPDAQEKIKAINNQIKHLYYDGLPKPVMLNA